MEKEKYYMNLALEEAKKASKMDEVPIGCIIVKDEEVIAKSYNLKEISKVATYHAEILAINEACRKLKTWHLEECTLYTTVEPCLMCTGAIIQCRIKKVVYGTSNSPFGYLSKLGNPKIEVFPNVLENECKQIISDFFKNKRKKIVNLKIKS
jgi:tRNA(adenine34) deaminase